MNKETCPIRYFFSHPTSSRTSSNCLSHKRLANGWPYRFHSKSTTGSSMLPPWFWPFGPWKTSKSGHSDFGFRAILERPPFLPECQQISRRLLVRQPGSLAMTSITLCSSHLQNWWTLFSKHCTRYRIVLAISPRSTTNVWNLLSKKHEDPRGKQMKKLRWPIYDLVHTFFLKPQAMKIPDALPAVDMDWKKLSQTVLSWQLGKVTTARRRFFWKHKNEKKDHSAT